MKGLLGGLLALALVSGGLLYGAGKLSQRTQRERLAFMEQSLVRSAVQCYAINGAYPRNLEELTRSGTVSLDRDDYIYHYQYRGSNLLPEIMVFQQDTD